MHAASLSRLSSIKIYIYTPPLTHTNTQKNLWGLLFQFRGSVWSSVLTYCSLNTALTFLIYYLQNVEGVRITFSGAGHGLMSLLVSYLVVSKVYLSLDRYMEGREAVGGAMGAMRELHQAALI